MSDDDNDLAGHRSGDGGGFFGGLGALPGHEVALRVVLAAVVAAPFLGALQQDLASALRALHADFLQERFCVLAFREARACQEFPVRPVLDHHHAAADFAGCVGHLVGYLHLRQVLGSFLDRLVQIGIEIPVDGLPGDLPVCHDI